MRSKAIFEVNINSFKKNLELIQKQCSQSELLLMVKANAYGHGAIPITQYAIEAGVKSFGLATMQEAVELRDKNPDPSIEFYVFSETELDKLELWKKKYLDLQIIPVIENLDELERVALDQDLSKVKIALKVNIGMNRFGIKKHEINRVCEILKKYKRDIYHLIGHLPCSPDLKKVNETKEQIDLFNNMKKEIEDYGVDIGHCSVSNSGAIERGLGLDYDFVRPGLLAYGCLSTKDNPMGWKGSIISSLKAKPLKTFPIKKGELFGYGSSPSPDDGHVVVIPLGYADGLTQNYSNVEFKCGDKAGRLIGYVNMDVCFLLFQDAYKQGGWIEVWGSSSQDFARLAKTTKIITYQLLCQISSRVPRFYKMS